MVRSRYEAGENPSAISRSLGGKPTRQGIYARIRKEGWEQGNELETPPAKIVDTYWNELEDNQKAVIEAFSKGARTIELAAERAGVSESTIYRWKKDDRFKRICRSARLAWRDKLVGRIDEAGEREWKANAWLLEKAFSEEFGQKQGPMQGNTFNVLGSIHLGIERSDVPQREGQTYEAEATLIDHSPEKGEG